MRKSVCAVLAFAFFFVVGTTDAKAQKNQMVKGTIKEVKLKDGVLVVNQKLKNAEVVERQLDIKDLTDFIIKENGKADKKVSGRDGLELLEGQEGASVNVKCDKDVNVLSVTVMLKKK
jgi:hypothetical protein